MSLKCGLVGLPNVGKSTLFNALTQTAQAEAANYPFCTIEPNTGRVPIYDANLQRIAQIAGSAKIIYNQLEFVDIAGLVKGASKGEGLGNQFLGHIREVDAIIHVLRCFEDEEIAHVSNKIDPVGDAEVIEMELILADLQSLERRLPTLEKSVKSGNKEAKSKLDFIRDIMKLLNAGQPAREYHGEEDLRELQLITAKKVLYVCNVAENDAVNGNSLSHLVVEMALKNGCQCCIISAKLEAEIANLENEGEKKEFMAACGLAESGINNVARATYKLLDMITYYTVGPKEARAWPIHIGTTADKAAGVIHTDFERGFIKAETIAFSDYIQYNGEHGCKEAGKVRFEGRDYITQDQDIMHFKFNV